MRDAYREVINDWEDYRTESDGYRELDDKRVLALIRLSGRGKASGLELGATHPEAAGVFHVRDGTVTRIALYWDRRRPFADLRLAPEGGVTGA